MACRGSARSESILINLKMMFVWWSMDTVEYHPIEDLGWDLSVFVWFSDLGTGMMLESDQ